MVPLPTRKEVRSATFSGEESVAQDVARILESVKGVLPAPISQQIAPTEELILLREMSSVKGHISLAGESRERFEIAA